MKPKVPLPRTKILPNEPDKEAKSLQARTVFNPIGLTCNSFCLNNILDLTVMAYKNCTWEASKTWAALYSKNGPPASLGFQ